MGDWVLIILLVTHAVTHTHIQPSGAGTTSEDDLTWRWFHLQEKAHLELRQKVTRFLQKNMLQQDAALDFPTAMFSRPQAACLMAFMLSDETEPLDTCFSQVYFFQAAGICLSTCQCEGSCTVLTIC